MKATNPATIKPTPIVGDVITSGGTPYLVIEFERTDSNNSEYGYANLLNGKAFGGYETMEALWAENPMDIIHPNADLLIP